MNSGDKPTIETPRVMADLAEEMAGDAAEGEGTKTDGRTVAPKLLAAKAKLRQAVTPLKWLGFEGLAQSVEEAADEVEQLNL